MSAELRRLLAEATPGPWIDAGDIESIPLTIASDPYAAIGRDPSPQWAKNAALIVAAVNALPALLDVADAARIWLDAWDRTEVESWAMNSAKRIDALRAAVGRLAES